MIRKATVEGGVVRGIPAADREELLMLLEDLGS